MDQNALTLYRLSDAARFLNHDRLTVQLAIERGDLDVFARTPTGAYLMTEDALVAFQNLRATNPRFAHVMVREANLKARLQK